MSASSPWPDHDTLMSAIALANRAPSVHNTQPWRWLVGTRSLHLMADRTRWLPATDPHGRDLVMSCGAALHHLRVALAARGWSTVDLSVDAEGDDHLAALGLRPCPPEGAELAAAIPLRRTDRRRYSARPVPDRAVAELARAAARLGVAAIPLVGEEERLEVAVSLLAGAARQRVDPRVRRELVHWTGRTHGLPEGVPAANSPSGAVRHGGLPMRYFPRGVLTEPPGGPVGPDVGLLLVLATAGDTRAAWLRAGEAASAVLLAATTLGMATCVLSQNVEVDGVRARLRDRLLAGRGEPQLVIRVGYAPESAGPLPATARRPVGEVCHRLPGTGSRPRRA
ncbi:Acg family FMN-binding oxidoreductase [Actinokineospora fastidiosa]|uniref:NAD(P)H nitroreductase n=1 Tax=Actinokineospora fastidiosa TaxID=1816 RepID=A0A918GCK2_9PSEU|nr:nitroreductase family protein [Actinokineospora fastidiosa]GGS28419.1 NAD(P)H nitroreductase [Actinokineospora fastidiosa]